MKLINRARALPTVFLLGVFLHMLHADPLQNWAWRGFFPPGATINAVTFGQDKFVAVCNDGVILTSLNAETWERVRPSTSNSLNGVGYGGGLFVAVGYQTILTSTNGRDWTDCSDGIGSFLSAVAFGNGTVVAVGFGGAIYSSTNGLNWTHRVPGPAAGLVSNLPGITFFNGEFFAAGILGIISSPDGIEWTNRCTDGQFYAIAHGNGVLAAVGDHNSKTNLVRYSNDGGNTWLPGSAGTNGLWLKSVTYGAAGFVAVATGGSTVISPDAQVWSVSTNFPPPVTPLAITYAHNLYVAGGGSSIWTSSNATFWKRIGEWVSLSGVAFGNELHVAVGTETNSFTSTDGVAWKRHDLGLRLLSRCLAYGNGTFVAAGIFGNLFTSPDGAHWTPQTAGTNLHLNGIAYGLSNFVIVCSGGVVLTSSNAAQWQSRPSSVTADLNDVTWTGREFVVCTREGGIVRSSNLVQWTSRQIATNSSTNIYSLSGVTYGNGRYVVVGKHMRIITDYIITEGIVAISSNAIDWSLQPFPQIFGLTRVTFAHGTFVAIGERGVILTSTNGTNWITRDSGTTRDLAGICYGKGRFVAGGPNSIVQSGFYGPPVVSGIWSTPSGLLVEIGAGPDQNCRLQYKDSLFEPNWQNLQSFTSSELPFRFTDVQATNSIHRFYRVAMP
jgi:hypothetical protein